jgi:CRP/FNR family transcriptional regulator, cyclic AMP receptor protein
VDREGLVEALASFAIFADLPRPQLEAVVHTFHEQRFPEGQRVLRQGISGAGFHVIVEGEAAVRIDGEQRARLGRGEFFGELSVLLGDLPVADVVALSALRCLVLPGPDLEQWLLSRPTVALRMLQTELRRLRSANTWRS